MKNSKIPQGESLIELLRLKETSTSLIETFHRVAQNPLIDFLNHEGKNLRAKSVFAGFVLGGGKVLPSACHEIAECIELIHSGSLIVDDIQDEATVRRGTPAFHRIHGTPSALNCGNLLYFLGLRKLATTGLNPQVELACHRKLNEELSRAHYGQALDIGSVMDTIPQDEVRELCLTSIRLKSGVLMSLAISLGAMVSEANDHKLKIIDEFGHCLGMGLQMFDDLKNLALLPPEDPNHAKRFEDLRLLRPSWIWVEAATHCTKQEYEEFINCVRNLPDERHLMDWMEKHNFIQRARRNASAFIEDAFLVLERELPVSEHEKEALEVFRNVTRQFGK